MSEDRVKVTCFDPKPGESETQELDPNSYIIICGQNRYVAHEMLFPKSGTAQLTIKAVGS
jgi:hypothetical protein